MVLIIAVGGCRLVRRPGRARTGGRSRTAGGCPAARRRASRSSARPPWRAGLLVWSYRKFHGNPEAIAAVEAAAKADDDRERFWRTDVWSASAARIGSRCGAPPPPRPADRPARRRPRRAAVDAAGRPVRDRARAGARRAASSGGSASGCRTGSAPRRRGGDGVCAGVEFRFPRSLIAELTGTRDEDPWAPDALAWPLLVGARRVASTSRGRPRWRSTSATATPATRRSSGAAAATPSPAGSPACSRRTPPSGRSCSSTGPPAGDTDGLGGDLDADLAWQPPLWRALTDAVDAPVPAERHAETARPAARPGPCDLPPRISLFGHTRMPVDRDRAAARARPAPRPAPLAAAPERRPVGAARRPRRADAAHRRRQPPPGPAPAARLARPRPARAAAQPRPAADGTTPRSPRRRCPAPCSAGSSPTCAPTPSVPQGRTHADRRPVGPGAPLPRAGPPGPGAPRGAARAARGRPDASSRATSS